MTWPLCLPEGNPVLTVTHPEPVIWILELHNGPDSRLTASLISDAFMPALDAVERDWRAARQDKDIATEKDMSVGAGALVIVGNTKQDKFFSNGLDYENAMKDPFFLQETLIPFSNRLLTFPIPTVAAINGHCFAAAFAIALTCDYRVMRSDSARNAFLSTNEVHFGAPWSVSMAVLFRAKVDDSRALRAIALQGDRLTPGKAKELGLVDEVYGETTQETLGKAVEYAKRVAPAARMGAWGLIKMDLYRDTIEASGRDLRVVTPAIDDARAKARL